MSSCTPILRKAMIGVGLPAVNEGEEAVNTQVKSAPTGTPRTVAATARLRDPP